MDDYSRRYEIIFSKKEVGGLVRELSTAAKRRKDLDIEEGRTPSDVQNCSFK